MSWKSALLTLTPAAAAVVGIACIGVTFEDPAVIEVSASVDRTSIAPGDTLRITIEAKNPMPGTLRFQMASGCLLLYEIRSASGEVVEPVGGGWVCPAVIRNVEFGPGEVKRTVGAWTGTRKRATLDAEGRTVIQRDPVAPGRYEIVGYVGQFRLAVSWPVEVEVRGD